MIFIRSNRYDRIGNISMPLAKQWPECVFVMNGIQGKRETNGGKGHDEGGKNMH